MNDLELYRRRDREASSILFDRYADRLYNVVRSILKDPVRSEDVTQEVFVRLLERRDSPTNFRPWLYRVAYNEALQALRSDRRRERREEHSAIREEAMPADEAAIRAEVWRSVEGLEEELRLPLLLRFQHGLSFAEIADVLDRPRGTVSRQIHEAKEKLELRLSRVAPAFIVGDALPLHRLPEGLKAKLAELARRWIPATSSGDSKSWPAKLPLGLAIGLPAIVIGAWVISCTREKRPDPVYRKEVSAKAVEERSADTADAARTEAEREPLPPSVRSREALLRVVLTDPVKGSPVLDPWVLQARPLFRFEDLKAERSGGATLNLRDDQAGVYEGAVPCTGRTCYFLFAIPKVSDLSTQTMLTPLGWIAAGPGEVAEKRTTLDSTGRRQELRDILLAELASTRSFGAIRGRVRQFRGTPKIDATSEDPAEFGFRGFGFGGPIFWEAADEFLYMPIRPGDTELRLRDPCCSQAIPVTVRPGEIADIGVVVHVPKGDGVVAGVLFDENELPSSGARVTLSERVSPRGRNRVISTTTDPAGRFRFGGLDPNWAGPQLSVSLAGRFGLRDIATRIGQTDLVLRLPHAYSIFVRILPSGKNYGVEVLTKEKSKVDVSQVVDRKDMIRVLVNADAVPPGSEARLRLHRGKEARITTDLLIFQENAIFEVRVEE